MSNTKHSIYYINERHNRAQKADQLNRLREKTRTYRMSLESCLEKDKLQTEQKVREEQKTAEIELRSNLKREN